MTGLKRLRWKLRNWMTLASRRLVPWRVLMWMNDRFDVCWTTLASWKVGHTTTLEAIEGIRPNATCFGAKGGWDYCGKYQDSGEKWKVCLIRTKRAPDG